MLYKGIKPFNHACFRLSMATWCKLAVLRWQVAELSEDTGLRRRPGKRLTSPERWEVGQLIKSGVLDITDYPTFDEEGQVSLRIHSHRICPQPAIVCTRLLWVSSIWRCSMCMLPQSHFLLMHATSPDCLNIYSDLQTHDSCLPHSSCAVRCVLESTDVSLCNNCFGVTYGLCMHT
jgi:hypothetical protein